MCLPLTKAPKVVSSTANEDKDVATLRNPYLDGLPSILRARRGGVQSLTIRRGGASGTANVPSPALPGVPTLATGGGSSTADTTTPGRSLVGSALTIRKAQQ